MIYIILC